MAGCAADAGLSAGVVPHGGDGGTNRGEGATVRAPPTAVGGASDGIVPSMTEGEAARRCPSGVHQPRAPEAAPP